MSIARTATGIEGALLIDANGALVTSTSIMVGEMRMFLVPPSTSSGEDSRWVKLDGSTLDERKYPRLKGGLNKEGKLPKIEYMWVYTG
jgi:hypothetical protein